MLTWSLIISILDLVGKVLTILIVVGVIGTAYVTYSSKKIGVLQKSLASKEPAVTKTPIPSLHPTATVVTEVHSADGSMNLLMKKVSNEGSSSYSFFVTGGELNDLLIFSKTLTTGEMSVPLNSWAPDNKHFFIIENNDVLDNYLVFKSTGEAFADGTVYIDFKSHYALKMKEFTLRDVTGWDAPDLLHVRTSGPAYWFELGSNAFYRLVQR